jgi:hypothetical protein
MEVAGTILPLANLTRAYNRILANFLLTSRQTTMVTGPWEITRLFRNACSLIFILDDLALARPYSPPMSNTAIIDERDAVFSEGWISGGTEIEYMGTTSASISSSSTMILNFVGVFHLVYQFAFSS